MVSLNHSSFPFTRFGVVTKLLKLGIQIRHTRSKSLSVGTTLVDLNSSAVVLMKAHHERDILPFAEMISGTVRRKRR